MNLPVILDIVIGLIFIYLSFSLLSSEIQSILTTILQWRAAHLKKSIEELIIGQTYISQNNLESNVEIKKVKQLANSLYQNPLIKALNYSGGKGGLERAFRRITEIIGSVIRLVTRSESIFDKEKTAPSHIPSNKFAASLSDTLKIPELIKTISDYKLEDFKNQKLLKIQIILNELNLEEPSKKQIIEADFQNLHKELDIIFNDYKKNDSANINMALDRILDRLNLYTKKSLTDLPETVQSKFEEQMILVKQVLTNPQEREFLISEIEPSFSNLLDFWKKLIEIGKVSQVDFQSKNGKIYQKIQEMLELLPKSLQNNLYTLAKQARVKITKESDALNQFHKEIEQWFDHGIERASGVYKRNARGVAFLIGITIAIVANVDSLHIINSLSTDSLLRTTINHYSEELINNNPNSSELKIEDIKNQVNAASDDLKLPIGWGQKLTDKPGENKSLVWVKKILGWIISGIAISMGADFWFNLLKKIVDVKK
ncbi:MAG: hypothetical protein MGG11_14575 [Trichodesmium sp. MAG_R03]|nr:hypothetical protein [Trichodesmium sp. MAG_R03]